MPRVFTPVELVLEDGWRAEASDVSATGMRITTLAVLQPGIELSLELPLEGDRSIPLRARVVWAEPPEPARQKLGSAGLDLISPPAEYLTWVAGVFAAQ